MSKDLFEMGKSCGLSDLEAEFLVRIGAYLKKNKVRFESQVIGEMAQRYPNLEHEVLNKADRRAYDEWLEAYYG